MNVNPARRVMLALATALCVVAVMLAAPAQATEPYPTCDGRRPSKDDVTLAKLLNIRAADKYQIADYKGAIDLWKEAYKADCGAHALLINLANVYERSGDKSATIFALETFLQRAPLDKAAGIIGTRLTTLKKSLQPETAPPPPSKPAPPPSKPAPTRPPTTISAPSTVKPIVAKRKPAPIATDDKQSSAPLILMGSGGAIAVVGIIMVPIGVAKAHDTEQACPGRQCTSQDDVDRGNAARTQTIVGMTLAGVGVATFASGLAWRIFGSTHLAPTAHVNGAGLTARGTF